jgi:DNA-binding transcriptional LysR family regulator
MELRHLRYFIAIAEEQSFSRAAERLWVAQPSLSTQIRRLEAELGTQLFDRHTRGVDLTDAGELFLERARATVAAAEDALSTGRDLEAGLVGNIRLGISTGARSHLVPRLLESFGRDRPDVELTVFESHGGTLLRDLRDGRLDAIVGPAIFDPGDLYRVDLGREPWLVLAGSAHRLGAGRGPVGAHELQGEEFVVTGHRDGGAYDRAVAETLAGLGLTPVLRRGGPGPALFACVDSGEGLALTTEAAAAGGIVIRPLDPARWLDFALLWREQTPSPALQGFIAAAGEIAQPDRPVLVAVA